MENFKKLLFTTSVCKFVSLYIPVKEGESLFLLVSLSPSGDSIKSILVLSLFTLESPMIKINETTSWKGDMTG